MESAGALYLRRYEEMMDAQDNEDVSTVAHLRPIFLTLQQMNPVDKFQAEESREQGKQISSHKDQRKTDSFKAHHQEEFPPNTSFYPQSLAFQNAGLPQLSTISSTPSKSTSLSPPSSDDRGDLHRIGTQDSSTISEYAEARLGLLSFHAMRYFLSTANTQSHNVSAPSGSEYDILRTDAQLIMVLTTLVEARDVLSQSRLTSSAELQKQEGISFVEFVHAYKTVISGMQVLQLLPEKKEIEERFSETEESVDWIFYERDLVRERTLEMVKSFARPALPLESFDTVSGVADSFISVTNATNTSTAIKQETEPDSQHQNINASVKEIDELKQELDLKQNQLNQTEQGRRFLSLLVVILIMICGASSSNQLQKKAVLHEGGATSPADIGHIQGQLDAATKSIGLMVLQAEELENTIFQQRAALVQCESEEFDNCVESPVFKKCQEELSWIEGKLKKCYQGEIEQKDVKISYTGYIDLEGIESLERSHKEVTLKRRKVFGIIGAAVVPTITRFILNAKKHLAQMIRVFAKR